MLTPTLWNTFETILSTNLLLNSISSSKAPDTNIIIKDIVSKNKVSALIFKPVIVLPCISSPKLPNVANHRRQKAERRRRDAFYRLSAFALLGFIIIHSYDDISYFLSFFNILICLDYLF